MLPFEALLNLGSNRMGTVHVLSLFYGPEKLFNFVELAELPKLH